MKITCTKCGKRFDGEENLYICPKCNHYHSQVGARDKMTVKTESSDLFRNKKSNSEIFRDGNILDMIDDFIAPDDTSNDEPEFIQTLNGEQKVYTAVPEKKSESTFEPGGAVKKIGLAICIVIGFILFITSTLGEFDEWSDDSDSWDSGWESSYNEEIVVDYGDPIEFEYFTVNVGPVGRSQYDMLKAEEGYQLVQVNFVTESTYEDSDDIWTEVYLANMYEDEYGYNEEEHYALDETDVTSDRTIRNQLVEDGLMIGAQYPGEHFFLFEIPEETGELYLKIYSYYDEGEEYYRMPIEL